MKYFPFSGELYRPQLGLKSLDLREWIEVGADRTSQLALKQAILSGKDRDSALIVRAEAEKSCLELHEVLAQHLTEFFPQFYEFSHGRMRVNGKEFVPPSNGSEALMQAGLWVQEDWAILSAKAPVTLVAGCVCFPSRWSLADKIGKESEGIHAPVPQFSTIAKPTQGFLERVTADKPMWRLNWTIHDSDKLFCPGPHPSATDLTKDNIVERTFLRIERQTLRRLPATNAVAFSIRTYVHPLREIIADLERKRILADALRGLPGETAEYKGMKAFHSLLNDWFASHG